MESLTYLLLYLLRGSLPWFDSTPIWKSVVLDMKQTITTDELCKTFPPEFQQLLEHACNLSFTAKPDYKHFRSLFQGLHMRLVGRSPQFDWQASHYLLASMQQTQPIGDPDSVKAVEKQPTKK